MAVWSTIQWQARRELRRWDAEFFKPEYLRLESELLAANPKRVETFAFVTDGIHASPDWVEEDGMLYLSAKSIKDNEVIVEKNGFISMGQHLANPRTAARVGDVLITTVGTIGNAAVIEETDLPANMDRHLGIIRIHNSQEVDPYYLATFLNCAYGRFQSFREATGNVQLNLFIYAVSTLLVPTGECYNSVAKSVRDAYAMRRQAGKFYVEAEALLLHTLQLDHVAPAAKTYTAPFSKFTRTLRLDAQYYQPRYQQTITRLAASGLTVGQVAQPVRARFRPVPGTVFQYLEIGGLLDGGRVEPEPVAAEDAPSRAQTVLAAGDVVTSSVRPIRRLTGLLGPAQGGTVGTSGFIALRPTAVAPEVLTVYLRLPLICEILDLYTTATMYPTVTEADVLGLPFPQLSAAVQAEIVRLVQAGFAARQRATELLDEAKRRVEEFIKVA